jgi:small subunit ribosomal protein S20
MKKSIVKKKLSVLKRQRQTEEANTRNRARRSRARTFIKKFEKNLMLLEKNKDTSKDTVLDFFPQVQSELARAGHKGAFNEKSMSRKIKRLHGRMISVIAQKDQQQISSLVH